MPAMNAGSDEPASAAPGARFGKYRIIRRLGRGAFGTVYLALLPGPLGFAKRVALKTIRTDVVDADPRFVQSMANEARIGGLLQHSNIVDTVEFGEVDGRYYLAMPYIEGPTLTEVIKLERDHGFKLPRFAAVSLATDVCRGLYHAHRLKDLDGRRLNIVHRDIKPSNIIVDSEGTARILDFGIAKATSNQGRSTQVGMAKGTPRYMSPEQVQAKDLTPSSDIFSLGVVWFELITGRPLFDADSLLPLAHMIMQGDIRRDLDLAESMLAGSRPILARALQRDTERRYPDARLMATDLRRLTAEYPPDIEMSQLIAEMLDQVDRSHWHEIHGVSDLALESDLAGSSFTGKDTLTPSEVKGPTNGDGERPSVSEHDTTVPFFGMGGKPADDELPHPPLPSPPAQLEDHGGEREEDQRAEEQNGGQKGEQKEEGADTSRLPYVGLMALVAVVVLFLLGGIGILGWGVVQRWLPEEAGDAGEGEVGTRAGTGTEGGTEADGRPAGTEAVADGRPAGTETETETETESESESETESVTESVTETETESVTETESESVTETETETEADGRPAGTETETETETESESESETETETETEAVLASPGTLTLRTRPWARIYLDERHLGDNFLVKRRAIDGGDHVVRLVCPQLDNREKEFRFRIDGDDVNLGCWDFETMAACK